MMKNLLLSILILTGGTYGFTQDYRLDPAHTEVGFSVKHLLISNVKGRFTGFSGTFEYDKNSKTLKNLQIEIDPASVSTSQKDRDEHLRSDDFFDVKKYKKITFTADKATTSSDGSPFAVTGKLKMKDKEHPVTLQVTLNGEAEVEGTKKVAFTAMTEINRKNWGIDWNKTLDAGGVAVSDEVKILIEGEANLIQPKSK